MSVSEELNDLCLRNKSALAVFFMRSGLDADIAETCASGIFLRRSSIEIADITEWIASKRERFLEDAEYLEKRANEKRLIATTLGEIVAAIPVTA